MEQKPLVIGLGESGITVVGHVKRRSHVRGFEFAVMSHVLEEVKDSVLPNKFCFPFDNVDGDLLFKEKYLSLLSTKDVVIFVCYGGDAAAATLLPSLLKHAASIPRLKIYTLLALPEKTKTPRYHTHVETLRKAAARYSTRYLLIPTELVQLYGQDELPTTIQQLLRISLESFLYLFNTIADTAVSVFNTKGEMKFSVGYNRTTALKEAFNGLLVSTPDIRDGQQVIHIQTPGAVSLERIVFMAEQAGLHIDPSYLLVEQNKNLKAAMFARLWIFH